MELLLLERFFRHLVAHPVREERMQEVDGEGVIQQVLNLAPLMEEEEVVTVIAIRA